MSSRKHTLGKPSFWLAATKDQAKDTGMALVFVCCLVFLITGQRHAVSIGALLLLLDMIAPSLLKPVAVLWFGLSRVLGTIMSKLLLSLVFFLVLLPMGCLRRLCGKDDMRVRAFRRDQESVFRVRDHLFVSTDIEQPY